MKSVNYYETDTHIYFYGGIYSQWYPCNIVVNNRTYCTAEQFMMAAKAFLFRDEEAFDKITRSKDPAEQKALGRKVKNFDKNKWEAVARDYVYEANYAKFTQHEDLKKQLLDSGDKIIVEASPTDCIWGVGLRATDPKILDSKNWRGTNWLGEEIMKVRDILKQLNSSNDNPNLVVGGPHIDWEKFNES